jgi:hypothetical protein
MSQYPPASRGTPKPLATTESPIVASMAKGRPNVPSLADRRQKAMI